MSAKLITGLALVCAAMTSMFGSGFGSGIALAQPLNYNISKAVGYHEADTDIRSLFKQNGPTLTLSDQQQRQDFCNSEIQKWEPINAQHSISVDNAAWLEGCDNAALDAVNQGRAN